jgi:hypothetical protein
MQCCTAAYKVNYGGLAQPSSAEVQPSSPSPDLDPGIDPGIWFQSERDARVRPEHDDYEAFSGYMNCFQ